MGVVGGADVDAALPHRHIAQVHVAHHLPQRCSEAAHTGPVGSDGSDVEVKGDRLR